MQRGGDVAYGVAIYNIVSGIVIKWVVMFKIIHKPKGKQIAVLLF